MKDLILITAYCPDEHRENILRNLVNSLLKFKDTFVAISIMFIVYSFAKDLLKPSQREVA